MQSTEQGLFIDQELQHLFDGSRLFEQVSRFEGKVFRALENRKTVLIEHGGKHYFAKIHFGVGWKEIVKNLCQFRLPVLGAENEFKALNALREIGVDSLHPVAYCSNGRNPATRKSCIVTRALENTVSLEDLFTDGLPTPQQKRILVVKLARIARRIHASGINHRDFYLCHFLVDKSLLGASTQASIQASIQAGSIKDEPTAGSRTAASETSIRPFLIDLHRAQIRKSTPLRWQVKDIGGLFFSGFDYAISRNDVFRFMIHYSGKSLRETLRSDRQFWHLVFNRARKLYFQEHSELPGWIRQLDLHR